MYNLSHGVWNLPWYGYLIYTLVMTHITMICVSLYLHRNQAHRAFDLHPAVAHFFRFWLYLTTGMKTAEWVSIHRLHHVASDTPQDPHSPKNEGIWTLLTQGAEVYRRAKATPDIKEKYGKGTPNDWVEKHIYSTPFLRGKLGIVIMLYLNIFFFGLVGIIIWAVQMLWTPLFAAGVINGIGHFFGYRNHETHEASRNVLPWGILIAGEELHNNHHMFGKSARFSVRWWEFDIGWMYIKCLRALGLAKVKYTIPKEVLDANKSNIDIETVRAIVNNRISFLHHYGRRVILPVFKQEQQNTTDANKHNSLTRKVRSILVRNSFNTTEKDKQSVKQALLCSKQLQTVYDFREQLQAIWSKKTATQKELIESLKDWCHKAEQSGIKALQDFSCFVMQYKVS